MGGREGNEREREREREGGGERQGNDWQVTWGTQLVNSQSSVEK